MMAALPFSPPSAVGRFIGGHEDVPEPLPPAARAVMVFLDAILVAAVARKIRINPTSNHVDAGELTDYLDVEIE